MTDDTVEQTEETAAKPRRIRRAADAPNVKPERVWITLEDNKGIPPRGQYFGINGAGFILRPGKKACVPQGIVDILDNAVVNVPSVNSDTLQIDGWTEQLRYPYRLHGPA